MHELWCAVGFVVLREFSVCSRGEVRMHTATWLYRDQRLRETCATPPCAPHWLPDAPLSCWVAQLARRQHTSNVELPSHAFVMSWRGVRGGQWLVRPALYLWRWYSDTVCAQSYKHTVCVCYMFSDPLCPVGSVYGWNCSMTFASESCDRVCFCYVVGLHSSAPL